MKRLILALAAVALFAASSEACGRRAARVEARKARLQKTACTAKAVVAAPAKAVAKVVRSVGSVCGPNGCK